VTSAVSLTSTLVQTLAAMRGQAPAMYASVSARLRNAPTRMYVDDEIIPLTSDGAVVALHEPLETFSVHVHTDRRTLLDLATGRAELVASILGDRLFVAGNIASLVAVDGALALFLSWAIRSPAARRLFQQYRDEGRRGDHA
jgi:hypothetical protein